VESWALRSHINTAVIVGIPSGVFDKNIIITMTTLDEKRVRSG
jgi:hypothetical protein